MPAKQEPNIGINYGWDAGESGINLQLDENWRAIGALLQLSVVSKTTDVPATPNPGDRYIIPTGATGDWSGHDGKVARYNEGVWEIYTPLKGWLAYVQDEATDGQYQFFDGSTWAPAPIDDAGQVVFNDTVAQLGVADVQAAIEALKALIDQGGGGTVADGSVDVTKLADFAQDTGTTTGLTFGFKAGKIRNDNAVTVTAAGTVTLTDESTNYVEVAPDGTVSSNVTGFTSGRVPLFTVPTGGGAITNVTDQRTWMDAGTGGSSGGGDVSSVFGRTGAVTAQNGDYTPEQVGADPAGTASTAVSNHEDAADPHTQYVHKVAGKGLSTEDYTTAEKDKVANLAPVASSGNYNDLNNKPDLSALSEISEYADFASFPATGEGGKVYIANDTGYMYRWNGSGYTQLTDQTAIWGQVGGNLGDQTDLQNALNGKEDSGTAASAVTAHEDKADPHSQYLIGDQATSTEMDNGAADKFPDAAEVKRYVDVNAGGGGATNSQSNVLWDPVSDEYDRVGTSVDVTTIHERMRRCVVQDDGTVAYYLDPHDSTLKEDGSPANLDGSDGQVMVEIPKCYIRVSQLFNGKWKREISEFPQSGFVLHPEFAIGGTLQHDALTGVWHYKDHTGERDFTYVGAYQASVFDTSAGNYIDGLNLDNNDSRVDYANDVLASVSGKYPMVGVTRAQMRQLASNRGSGWSQWTFWQWNLLKTLFFVEYGGFDGQALLAAGNSDVSSGYPSSSSNQSDSPHSVAGKSNAIGNDSGGVDSSNRDTAWMSYRGVENFWGNTWQFVDGFNVNDWMWYVANDPTNFADDTTTGYTQLGDAAPSSNGYIRNVQHETLGDVPSDSSGNSSTAFADYYYQSSGWKMALVGGYATIGSNVGPSCVIVTYGSGNRSRNISGRLALH